MFRRHLRVPLLLLHAASTPNAAQLHPQPNAHSTMSHRAALRPLSILTSRHYATHADNPYRWPSSLHPTPYEILEVPAKGPYNKRRYVELVKIYHPDHSVHHNHDCPRHVRLERFRLVVNANRILSDAALRAAYDRYGLGWHAGSGATIGGRPGAAEKWWREREGHESTIFSSAYGKGGKDDASANATWEDWERWYAARGEGPMGKQQPIHTNNGVFLAIVVAVATVGTMAEINYATGASEENIELLDRQSTNLGRDVARRRREAMDSGDREERIKKFLIMRDPVEARKFMGPQGNGKLLATSPSSTSYGEEGVVGGQEQQ
jgi:curved DNA-binding protein CbpA